MSRNSSFKTQNYQAVLTHDDLFDRVYRLRSAYNPGVTGYKFSYIFYNRRLSDDNPKPPANISEEDWAQAFRNCPDPDHLIPVALNGFEAIHTRVDAQKQLTKEIQQRLVLIQAKLRSMTSSFSTELVANFQRIKQNNEAIGQRMLDAIGAAEVQRHQGTPLSAAEQAVLTRLEQMRLSLTQPGSYLSAIRNLEKKVSSVPIKKPREYRLDAEALRSIATALQNNQSCLNALESVVKSLQTEISHADLTVSELS